MMNWLEKPPIPKSVVRNFIILFIVQIGLVIVAPLVIWGLHDTGCKGCSELKVPFIVRTLQIFYFYMVPALEIITVPITFVVFSLYLLDKFKVQVKARMSFVNGFVITVIGVPVIFYLMMVVGFEDFADSIVESAMPLIALFEYISKPIMALQHLLWGDFFGRMLVRLLAILEIAFVFLPIVGGLVGLFIHKLRKVARRG